MIQRMPKRKVVSSYSKKEIMIDSPDIQISITGKPKSGKTTIGMILIKELSKFGAKITFEGYDEYRPSIKHIDKDIVISITEKHE